jgi:hypothetical protein
VITRVCRWVVTSILTLATLVSCSSVQTPAPTLARQLIVVVPDQRLVTAIESANGAEYPLSVDTLIPLLTKIIIPRLDS